MQSEFFVRLSDSVQQFILDFETVAGVEIHVFPTADLNGDGPTGIGKLEIIIEAQTIELRAPTNGYFPDGAVRHEVLHARRFHIEGVPKLALADSEPWDKQYAGALGDLDNAIEHILIVPIELQLHPERRTHWEAVMQRVCAELPQTPAAERALAVCMHWTFLRLVLPESPQIAVTALFAKEHGLLDIANHFADQLLAVKASKEAIVQLIFQTFPEIPKNRAAFEYINSVTGTRQRPIA